MKISVKVINGYIVPNNSDDAERLKDFKDGVYDIEINNSDTRSKKQNRALHLWFNMISATLNNSGATIPKVVKLETLWSATSVKELIFRPTMKKIYNKTSSTKLNKDEFDLLIDSITLAFGNKGIEIPSFPEFDT